jgi:hypothetical protein
MGHASKTKTKKRTATLQIKKKPTGADLLVTSGFSKVCQFYLPIESSEGTVGRLDVVQEGKLFNSDENK